MKLLKCRYPIRRAIWSKRLSFLGGRKMGIEMEMRDLDQEWIELVKQARAEGFTKEEVRQFLLEKNEKEDLQLSRLEKVN